MFVFPDNFMICETHRKHFIVESTIESSISSECGRSSSVCTRGNIEHLFAVADSDCAKHLVASCNKGDAVQDARRCVNGTVSLELPKHGAVSCRYAIKVLVVRTN